MSKINIRRLNAWQRASWIHPFTCGSGNRSDEHHLDGEGVLVATESGWICPYCDYSQAYREFEEKISVQDVPPHPLAATAVINETLKQQEGKNYVVDPSCESLQQMWKDLNEPIPLIKLMSSLAEYLNQVVESSAPLMTQMVLQLGDESATVLHLWATSTPELTPIGRVKQLREMYDKLKNEHEACTATLAAV